MTRAIAFLILCLAATVIASPFELDTAAVSTGVPQDTTRVTGSALSIVFLYDLTLSVTYEPVSLDNGLKQVTEWLISDLRSGDSVRFGFVTRRLYLSRRFAASELTDFYRREVQGTVVPDADRFGASPLWDSLDQTVATMASDPGRRAIIIMTDGRSTGNRHSAVDLVADAKAAGVSIWPVDYAPSEWFLPDRHGRLKDPANQLIAIAVETGGRYIGLPTPPPMTSLSVAFMAITPKLKAGLGRSFGIAPSLTRRSCYLSSEKLHLPEE